MNLLKYKNETQQKEKDFDEEILKLKNKIKVD